MNIIQYLFNWNLDYFLSLCITINKQRKIIIFCFLFVQVRKVKLHTWGVFIIISSRVCLRYSYLLFYFFFNDKSLFFLTKCICLKVFNWNFLDYCYYYLLSYLISNMAPFTFTLFAPYNKQAALRVCLFIYLFIFCLFKIFF